MRKWNLQTAEPLPTAPGTYALLLHLAHRTRIQVGRLGAFDFPRGYYVYVGSARGAGGLHSRVMRHFNFTKCLHWHIDYLRATAHPVCVWYSTNARDDECALVAMMQAKGACIVAPRFGSSDCDCASHLFYFQDEPKSWV